MHSYLNLANLAWGATQKTKLSSLYCQPKHSIRLLSFKDHFIHSIPLFKKTGALNIYEINIFNILCLMFKYKNKAYPQSFKKTIYLNPLSTNPTKWSNILKQFVCKLPTNCLSVFEHFVKLALKGLKPKSKH